MGRWLTVDVPRGGPFTGEVAEYFGENPVSLDSSAEGRVHGFSRERHGNGQLESERVCVDGRATGLWPTWHDNGRIASEKVFSEDGSLVETRTWDEQGRTTPGHSGPDPRIPHGAQ
ncbi:toxin-antitoxin system YwqK family antitoxin [Streptomyces clavuligerus]|uniref:toxin-antitoxin system YwqK family antitoxin n=1 Tax=Streptomyces clavuligerus TaxID=1901 RepID=UPI0001800805|nr:hypothetical protein [Streptomyces clavuligerus]EDY52952.1 conserved hypothetical protein [Streptomyces clavuligerus]WDN55920.1 hypothetical protein LL058_28910 [Streptomyces clavuligerus]